MDKNKAMMKKVYPFEIKQMVEEDRVIEGVITKLTVDRDGEVLIPMGGMFDAYMKNPVGLWMHNNAMLPVFHTLELTPTDQELVARMQFFDKEENPFSENLFLLYSRGKMSAFSHAFIPIEWTDAPVLPDQKGRTFLKWELLEISCVTVPSNREALVTEGDKALCKAWEAVTGESLGGGEPTGQQGQDIQDVTDREKKVVSYKEFPLADEKTAWKFDAQMANAIIDKGGWTLYRDVHSWYDPEADENDPPEVRGAYKLPHHAIVENQVKTIWRGVAAAMAALLGARGGVQIPDNDRKGVYNHLAKHYEQFDKEPPEFKECDGVSIEEKFPEVSRGEIMRVLYPLEDAFVPPYRGKVIEFPTLDAAVKAMVTDIREMKEHLKEGRVISASNLNKINAALRSISEAVKELTALLDAAKRPDDGERSITELLTVMDIMQTIDKCKKKLETLLDKTRTN